MAQPPATSRKNLGFDDDPPESSDVRSSDSTASEDSEGNPRTGVFRRGGTLPTAICLSKASIGIGLVSMPGHTADAGLLYQLVCLTFGAVGTLLSIRMIAQAAVATNSYSFEDICEVLFNPTMSIFTGLVNVCTCIGTSAGYLIVCGQVFQVLFDADETSRKQFIVLVGTFVCAPIALLRHVGNLRHLATFSLGALFMVFVVMIWYLSDMGTDETINSHSLWIGRPDVNGRWICYMNGISNVITAYNNQFNVPQLTGELTPQPSANEFTKVAGLTTALCFAMYTSMSVLGILAFGVGYEQKDDLIVDLEHVVNSLLVPLTLFALMYSMLTSFMFHIYPIRQFATYIVRHVRGRAADGELSDTHYYGRSLTRWLDIAASLSAVFFIILVAVVIVRVKTIVDFVGAFSASYISYIIPPLWSIQVARREKEFRWLRPDIVFYMSFFTMGLFFFAFGTYSAVVAANHTELQ